MVKNGKNEGKIRKNVGKWGIMGKMRKKRKPEAAKARSGSFGPQAETGNQKPEAEMGKNVEK